MKNIEKVEIIRNSNGELTKINGIEHIEKLLNDYKKEELPGSDEPFHYDAEAAAGFKFFVEWLKRF